jgi:hypothetical protein
MDLCEIDYGGWRSYETDSVAHNVVCGVSNFEPFDFCYQKVNLVE